LSLFDNSVTFASLSYDLYFSNSSIARLSFTSRAP
jgi:hypothetical protein